MHTYVIPRIDKSGKKFGMLLIMRHSKEHSSKRVYWKAICDCGNTVYIANSNLVQTIKRGNHISCGCKQGVGSWKHTKENIVGKKYNLLTVIKELHTENRESMVLCRCDCGTEKKYRANAIKTGNTKSCGCFAKEQRSLCGSKNSVTCGKSGKRWEYNDIYYRSFVELLFAWHLTKNKILFDYEPRIFELTCSYRYKPDFFIPSTNEYIEIKGSQYTFSDISRKKTAMFSAKNKLKILFTSDVIKLLGKTYSHYYYQYIKKGWRP